MTYGGPRRRLRPGSLRARIAVLAACALRSWAQRVHVPPARNKGRRNKGRHRLYTETDPVPLQRGGRLAAASAQGPARLRDRVVRRLPTRAVGQMRAG